MIAFPIMIDECYELVYILRCVVEIGIGVNGKHRLNQQRNEEYGSKYNSHDLLCHKMTRGSLIFITDFLSALLDFCVS